jgi:phosphatidylglycerophosphate synthase
MRQGDPKSVNLDRAAKVRPRSEWIMVAIQPLASLGVRLLARTGIDPLAIVSTHGLRGLAAAALITVGGAGPWLIAALLLQLKTLLDNMDGGLARATSRVTQMGRYYDTVIDLVVNVALFAALALHSSPWLALASLLALTLLLSLDHNLKRLYRAERHDASSAESEPPIGAPPPVFRLFRGVYLALLAPQDRAIERLDRAAFTRLYGSAHAAAPVEFRLAWNDLFSTATLVNLGLSSQMLLLGAALALGRPGWYPLLVLAQLVYAVCVQLLRAIRFGRYCRNR